MKKYKKLKKEDKRLKTISKIESKKEELPKEEDKKEQELPKEKPVVEKSREDQEIDEKNDSKEEKVKPKEGNIVPKEDKVNKTKEKLVKIVKKNIESKKDFSTKNKVKSEKEKSIEGGTDVSKFGFQKQEKNFVDKYEIEVDKAKVTIRIARGDLGIIYNVEVPEISVATTALLNEVRDELVSATTIGMKEIIDPNAFKGIKERFLKEAEILLKSKIPTIKDDVKDFLIGKLIQDMLGLGEIEYLINDPNLEEVVIPSSKEPVKIYHKKYGWISTNLRVIREDQIVNYSSIIARRVGRQITVLTPLLDAHLITGDRVNAILYPISTKGNTITIRKFARDPYTIIDLIKNKTCNIEVASIIWIAIEYEMNIIISGGTASGKTSFLNACMSFIPPNHRIISVEDTRELMLPEFLYWTPLVTRTPNPEGKGGVTMLDLLVNSLRMRPDRIILGEMRRKEEALVLFEAMHTGHSVYATLHADSASETIARLTNPPLSIPKNLLKAVNLNVVMFRDRRKGIRRVLQVAEFQSEQDLISANILYRWLAENDEIIQHGESSRFFEDISRNTGMPQEEINKNLADKRKIFEWLIERNIRSLEDFGRVINLYYTDKEELLDDMAKNNIKKILGK